MSRANDSIIIIDGTGALVASETEAAKEYEVVVLADSGGRLIGLGDIYSIHAISRPDAASKHYLALINQPNSNVMLYIHRVDTWKESSGNVAGFARGIKLYRCTSASDGETIPNDLIEKFTSTSPMPGIPGVTASRAPASGAAGLTITGLATEPLGAAAVNDAAGGAGGARTNLFTSNSFGPLLLSTGQGITVQQDATAGLSSVSASIFFEIVT